MNRYSSMYSMEDPGSVLVARKDAKCDALMRQLLRAGYFSRIPRDIVCEVCKYLSFPRCMVHEIDRYEPSPAIIETEYICGFVANREMIVVGSCPSVPYHTVMTGRRVDKHGSTVNEYPVARHLYLLRQGSGGCDMRDKPYRGRYLYNNQTFTAWMPNNNFTQEAFCPASKRFVIRRQCDLACLYPTKGDTLINKSVMGYGLAAYTYSTSTGGVVYTYIIDEGTLSIIASLAIKPPRADLPDTWCRKIISVDVIRLLNYYVANVVFESIRYMYIFDKKGTLMHLQSEPYTHYSRIIPVAHSDKYAEVVQFKDTPAIVSIHCVMCIGNDV